MLCLLCVPLGLLSLRTPELSDRHFDPVRLEWQRPLRARKIHNTQIYQRIDELVPGDRVIFGVPNWEHLDLMFFSNKIAYGYLSDEEVDLLRSKKIPLAVVRNTRSREWLAARPDILVIEAELRLE